MYERSVTERIEPTVKLWESLTSGVLKPASPNAAATPFTTISAATVPAARTPRRRGEPRPTMRTWACRAATRSRGGIHPTGYRAKPWTMSMFAGSESGIANCYAENLLLRAADVTLKERRRLVLMVRETPLHKGHLELMLRATDYGAQILPPSPAFYHGRQTLDEVIDQTVGRALDCLGLQHELVPRWGPAAGTGPVEPEPRSR